MGWRPNRPTPPTPVGMNRVIDKNGVISVMYSVGGGGGVSGTSTSFWVGEGVPHREGRPRHRDTIECHNCGAPVGSHEKKCSYCLTEYSSSSFSVVKQPSPTRK